MDARQQTAVLRLDQLINGTERSCDASLERIGELFGELRSARRNLRASAQLAQPAVEALARAAALIVQARGEVVVAHVAMAAGAMVIGKASGATMDFQTFTGEGGYKPPPTAELDESASIHELTARTAA